MSSNPEDVPRLAEIAKNVAVNTCAIDEDSPTFVKPLLRDRRMSWSCGQADMKRMLDVA